VVVAATNNSYCPLLWLRSFLVFHDSNKNKETFLFGNLNNQGGFRNPSSPMSYSLARDIFKGKLTALGKISKDFGLHSLRAGGATEAANRGIPDRLFQRHGRWKSISSKNLYVQEA
jgi:hypothetical protein